jgi:hypothetical protein
MFAMQSCSRIMREQGCCNAHPAALQDDVLARMFATSATWFEKFSAPRPRASEALSSEWGPLYLAARTDGAAAPFRGRRR